MSAPLNVASKRRWAASSGNVSPALLSLPMTSPPRWPPYLAHLGSHDAILAMGVISLNYGQLESMFASLLASATGIPHPQMEALFPKIQNDVRLQLLEQLSPSQDWPTGLADHISHFASAYEICVKNRNGIVHSYAAGISVGGGIERRLVIGKKSRSGNELVHITDLSQLRKFADSMHDFVLYAARLSVVLTIYRAGALANPLNPPQPVSLPEKPQLPSELEFQLLPYPPPREPPPEPSQA